MLKASRLHALNTTSERQNPVQDDLLQYRGSEVFGKYIFNRKQIKKSLPKNVCSNLIKAMEGKEKLNPKYADTIATAIKDWAINLGATHYCHWFLPLTGLSAEKHDAFIQWDEADTVIDTFNGKQLIQGEPDASSFPSGGMRSTYEARGYTGWDPTSPVFVWKKGSSTTLYIPSVFFSWTGQVLDHKIPLLRSEKKLQEAVLRLLDLFGIKAKYVFPTLGVEQEYFVIDKSMRNLRADLLLCGRTVIGSMSPKGQEMQDHYFGSIKERVLNFIHDFEAKALSLGIPLKTRHNEVAPSQFESAPVFERASLAVDHNILLMELMRQVAAQHNLSCLLHEKPFAGLNGSGKHCNWSIATDKGLNLLDPSSFKRNKMCFLVLITALLEGVYKHVKLLRASVGSAGNDLRLGGHEAPPAIFSIYLGDELEHLLDSIEKKTLPKEKKKGEYDLGVLVIPNLEKDHTDRNRTSPFAFTGNKFEFRAVGSSANPAFPITVMNLVVAESLNNLLDEIESQGKDKILSVLSKSLKRSSAIRFSGDNYHKNWVKEAKKRNLPNIPCAYDAFKVFKETKTHQVFKDVLTKEELESYGEVFKENYINTLLIESKVMIELFQTQVLPASLQTKNLYAEGVKATFDLLKKKPKEQLNDLKDLDEVIEKAILCCKQLKQEIANTTNPKKIKEKMDRLRSLIDLLETLNADSHWPLLKYRELLFSI